MKRSEPNPSQPGVFLRTPIRVIYILVQATLIGIVYFPRLGNVEITSRMELANSQ